MPFSNLNNAWSNLAPYYNSVNSNGSFSNPNNVTYTQKPEQPTLKFTSFDDGLVRGGVVNAGLASVRDTARVGNFLKSPKGLVWVAKQVGLQKSNPRLEQPQDFRTLSNNNTQLYNLGLNTLTQIPLNAFGGHIIRHGVLPVGGVGFLEGSSLENVKGYNYEKIVTDNNILQGDTIGFFKGYSSGDYYGKNPNRLVQYLSIINNNDTGVINLLEYNGGSESVYGIGKTRINTTNTRTTIGKSILTPGFEKNLNGFSPLTNDQIILAPQADLDSVLTVQLENSPLINNYTSASLNIEARIGTSAKRKSNSNVDAINVINVTDSSTFYGNSLKSNNDPSLPKDLLNKGDKEVDGYFGRDIIKFRIEFLNNDLPVTSNLELNTDVLAFRAYLNEFSDGMNARWNSYRYMGRGEDFYVYDGFTRDISVGFTLYAHSPEEMKPIYSKLNYLMSSFAPDYAYNKMRGNIGYLTVGDYIYRQPGIFTDIKLSGMLESNWEISLDKNNPIDKTQYEVPKHINVALSFKPIHTFLPRRVQKGKFANAPFVTIDKKAYPAQAGEKWDLNKKPPTLLTPASNKYLD
jgi:hypothetical protein